MKYPSHDKIVCIINELRELILPEYFVNVRNCDEIEALLNEQIELALQYTNLASTVNELTNSIIAQIPSLREKLLLDATAGYEGDPAAYSVDEVILAYPGFFAILVHRIAHYIRSLGIPLIPRMMCEYAHSKTGIDINPGATIGNSFFIDHGTGVVIGETTHIGNNVKMYQGVTLGALSTKNVVELTGTKRHPTVQDDVVIYAGAAILGGNTVIGKGSTIGGNAFITSSVAPNSKVR